jgi:hypothetical protein
MDNYHEFKKKQLDNQQVKLNKKGAELKQKKLKLKIDKFNKQKQKIQKKMNTFVNGPSNYN